MKKIHNVRIKLLCCGRIKKKKKKQLVGGRVSRTDVAILFYLLKDIVVGRNLSDLLR